MMAVDPNGYVALRRGVVARATAGRPQALAAYRAILKRQCAGIAQRGDASRLLSLGQLLRLSGGVPKIEERG